MDLSITSGQTTNRTSTRPSSAVNCQTALCPIFPLIARRSGQVHFPQWEYFIALNSHRQLHGLHHVQGEVPPRSCSLKTFAETLSHHPNLPQFTRWSFLCPPQQLLESLILCIHLLLKTMDYHFNPYSPHWKGADIFSFIYNHFPGTIIEPGTKVAGLRALAHQLISENQPTASTSQDHQTTTRQTARGKYSPQVSNVSAASSMRHVSNFTPIFSLALRILNPRRLLATYKWSDQPPSGHVPP
jgi:hypothetical protein